MTEITWLGHATFQLRFDSGNVLLIDPWVESNPAYPKGHKIEKVDAIALSHGHFDHISDVIPLAKKFNAKVLTMAETAGWLEKKGVKNAVGMNKGGTADLGFVKLTMTHAIHSNGIKDGDEMVYGGEPAGFVITGSSGPVGYFAGDTDVFSEMALIREMYAPQIAILPIGDHYTMGPMQAAFAARLLGVKRVVPMHFGTFPALTGRPEALAEMVKGDGIEVWTLEPGKPFEWK